MNAKTKLILGGAALVAVIALSTMLYQTLTKNFSLNRLTPAPSMQQQTPDASDEKATADDTPKPVLAPDFSVEDTDGNLVKLSDFLGKPVVLNFWASWCGFCKKEMPDFDKVWTEMQDDVVFLMINTTNSHETKEMAQAFLDGTDFHFPVYYDVNQEAAYAYGVSSLPTTLFISPDGYLTAGSQGMIDEETLRRGIDMILPSTQGEVAAEYHKITPEEAKQKMDDLDDDILWDVRTQAEFDESRIEGAMLIPDTELRDRAETELLDKEATILVYCRSGRRSQQAAMTLVELGYRNVYDFGGINDWPYATVP